VKKKKLQNREIRTGFSFITNLREWVVTLVAIPLIVSRFKIAMRIAETVVEITLVTSENTVGDVTEFVVERMRLLVTRSFVSPL
jgi:hypothetical protein